MSVLGIKPTSLQSFEPAEDDWYANLIWIDRRKCVLLAHATTLFSVLVVDVLKRDLMPLGLWAVECISDELRREGLSTSSLGRLDPTAVELARTSSRRVLGYMNDMTRCCDFAVAEGGGLGRVDPRALNRELRRQVHVTRDAPGYFVPLERAAARRIAV